jgi:hypothetical protein
VDVCQTYATGKKLEKVIQRTFYAGKSAASPLATNQGSENWSTDLEKCTSTSKNGLEKLRISARKVQKPDKEEEKHL